jgi:hypothetical protein
VSLPGFDRLVAVVPVGSQKDRDTISRGHTRAPCCQGGWAARETPSTKHPREGAALLFASVCLALLVPSRVAECGLFAEARLRSGLATQSWLCWSALLGCGSPLEPATCYASTNRAAVAHRRRLFGRPSGRSQPSSTTSLSLGWLALRRPPAGEHSRADAQHGRGFVNKFVADSAGDCPGLSVNPLHTAPDTMRQSAKGPADPKSRPLETPASGALRGHTPTLGRSAWWGLRQVGAGEAVPNATGARGAGVATGRLAAPSARSRRA